MSAILINLQINEIEKFNLFKKTFSDICKLFKECHIKIRGELAEECLSFSENLFSGDFNKYQNLTSNDWVDATLTIVDNVKSETIFIYLEDHVLIGEAEKFSEIINEINNKKIDYVSYSFFRANNLMKENILPLNPTKSQNLSVFYLNSDSEKLINKISPNYYSLSLTSIISKKYFTEHLNGINYKYKIYNSRLMYFLWFFLGYPKNRICISKINKYLKLFNIGLCLYSPKTPFNFEQKCSETNFNKKNYKYGVLHNELFANFDDDNGSYGESLIKRGLYPYENKVKISNLNKSNVDLVISLSKDEEYDATYYGHWHRIRNPPVIGLKVLNGSISIEIGSEVFFINSGKSEYFYANKSPIIKALDDSKFVLEIYDELLH
jgi:hypothetical protein